MGFFGRVGNLLSGYISTKKSSSFEETLKEQALEKELKKPSATVKREAAQRLSELKEGENKRHVPDGSQQDDSPGVESAPLKPKKRTL